LARVPRSSVRNLCRTLQVVNRRAAIVGIKQTINLYPAGLHPPLFHFAGKLRRDHGLDDRRGDLLANPGFLKLAFEARACVRVFPCHDWLSTELTDQDQLTDIDRHL
jgi:hypothetical protein